MIHCGSCSKVIIGDGHKVAGYPEHEATGLYRCSVTGKFHTLTRAHDCSSHAPANNLEARRELIRKNKNDRTI